MVELSALFSGDVAGTSATTDELVTAINDVGTSRFYLSVLRLLGREIQHDLLALARYTRHSPPDLVAPEGFSKPAISRYLSGLYTLDPFYRFWSGPGSPGVITLREVAPANMWKSVYATEFLRDVNIDDEVCIFLPPINGASVTLLLDRAKGEFSPEERNRISKLFPIVASLHTLHIRTLLGTAPEELLMDRASVFAVRLIDGHGYELYRSSNWRDFPSSADSYAQSLSLDFVLAPGGQIEYRVFRHRDPATKTQELFAALTKQEKEIVRLTLRGYPTIAIAEMMNLAAGTVKNHRTRIFRKLDITTERELYLSAYGQLEA